MPTTYTRRIETALLQSGLTTGSTLGYTIKGVGDVVLVARTTLGVTEDGSSARYYADVPEWDTSWSGSIVWDAGSGTLDRESFTSTIPADGSSFTALLISELQIKAVAGLNNVTLDDLDPNRGFNLAGRVIEILGGPGSPRSVLILASNTATGEQTLATTMTTAMTTATTYATWRAPAAVDSLGRVTLAPAGLDAVTGWGSWSLRRTIQAIAQILGGIRSGVPTAGTAGTITFTGPSGVPYGTIAVDSAGDITANGMTPPA